MDKRYGITDITVLPLRLEMSERSEMVSQLLFGETYSVLDEIDRWLYVRSTVDGCEGWIDSQVYHPLDEAQFSAMTSVQQPLLTDLFRSASKTDDWGTYLLAAGSVLPDFDPSDSRFHIGSDRYHLLGQTLPAPVILTQREKVVQSALMYFNAPYLWGGRSPYGIDASGLVQMVYRLSGVAMPRYVEDQMEIGETLVFMEESLPGDLLFFGDHGKSITHVGILWEPGRVIHASGRVRVDRVDHHGIYNESTHRYTHALQIIERVIK